MEEGGDGIRFFWKRTKRHFSFLTSFSGTEASFVLLTYFWIEIQPCNGLFYLKRSLLPPPIE